MPCDKDKEFVIHSEGFLNVLERSLLEYCEILLEFK